MYILGIDSSTKKLSMAVSCNARAIAKLEYNLSAGFMINIMGLIDRLLKKSKVELSSIDAFCVNTGPGDFTGTRIGISIVKTFALVNNKPAYGINSLDVFSLAMLVKNAPKINSLLLRGCNVILIPLLDVRRNELFFSIYESNYARYSNVSGKVSVAGREIFINEMSKNHLVEYENFPGLLEKLFLSRNLSMSSISKTAIFLCGTAFETYKFLLNDLQKLKYGFFLDKRNVLPESEFLNLCAFFRIMNSTAVVRYPTGETVSTGVQQEKIGVPEGMMSERIVPERVVPFYVREFVPFNSNKQ